MEPQVFAERVAQYLRARHPSKTALYVEADTGISAKTVGKWLELAAGPTGRHYHTLLIAYPDLVLFIEADDPPLLFRHAARLARQATLEAKAAAIRDQLADLVGRA